MQTDRQTEIVLPFHTESEQFGKTAHRHPLKQGERRGTVLLPSQSPSCHSTTWEMHPGSVRGWHRGHSKCPRLKQSVAPAQNICCRITPAPLGTDSSLSWCRWQGRTPPHGCTCFPQQGGTARGKEAEDGAEAWAGGLRESAWEQAPVRLAEKWVIFLLKNSEKMEK